MIRKISPKKFEPTKNFYQQKPPPKRSAVSMKNQMILRRERVKLEKKKEFTQLEQLTLNGLRDKYRKLIEINLKNSH